MLGDCYKCTIYYNSAHTSTRAKDIKNTTLNEEAYSSPHFGMGHLLAGCLLAGFNITLLCGQLKHDGGSAFSQLQVVRSCELLLVKTTDVADL